MSSSTSSSDPSSDQAGDHRKWRQTAGWFFGGAAALAFVIMALVIIVDPFDTLPVSPPLDRVPISSNARFSFPALARAERFDSAIIGTSTSRLLRPDMLDGLLDGKFVNLAMNSATAYEQYRMLALFGRHHPEMQFLIMGVDLVWCGTGDSFEKYTPRPFPEWMYDDNRWNDFLHHFDFFTLEQTGRQLATMLGLRAVKYGRDGYTDFLPDPSEYDLGKVRQSLVKMRELNIQAPKAGGDFAPDRLTFPTHPMLAELLRGLPADTQKLLFFAPYHRAQHPLADSIPGREWFECKQRIARLAADIPNMRVADFMIASPFTTRDENYWDPLHYSVAAADELMRDLAAAMTGEKTGSNFDLLAPGMQPRPFPGTAD